MKKAIPLAAVVFAAALPLTSWSQNATTTPVGVVTLEVKAKPANSRSFNFLSLPLIRPAVFSGVIPSGGISTVSGRTVLTFPANTFGSSSFAATTAPHYVEIATGVHAGITSQVFSNTNSTITLTDDLSEVLVAGTTPITIRPNWTLGTAFPNGEGFQKGTTATNSDNVILFNPDNGAQLVYFYSTSANEWRSGLTPSNHVIIPPDSGVWVDRKSTSGNFTFKVTGEVKTNQSAIFIGGDAETKRTIAPNLYPLDSVTLQSSGLYTGSNSTGLAPGTNSNNSDNLVIFDPVTGSQTVYFYSSGANEWRTGSTPANTIRIPSNASVMIVRKAGRQPFVWYLPRPAMSLN
jgi:uncharacterized protein (TIGR02597 family)